MLLDRVSAYVRCCLQEVQPMTVYYGNSATSNWGIIAFLERCSSNHNIGTPSMKTRPNGRASAPFSSLSHLFLVGNDHAPRTEVPRATVSDRRGKKHMVVAGPLTGPWGMSARYFSIILDMDPQMLAPELTPLHSVDVRPRRNGAGEYSEYQ